MNPSTRLALAVGVGFWIAATPAVVHADPPRATNVHSTVVAIHPPLPTVQAVIVGDSLLELRVAAGTAVSVAGYFNEPYLRFLESGEVLENRRAVTYFTNQSRTGASVPEGVTAESPPDWHTVATDGGFMWHDHRAHWMGTGPPLNSEPGSVAFDSLVPIVVGGEPVNIRVVGTVQATPSPTAMWVGLGIGLAVAGNTRRRGRSETTSVVAGVIAAVALAIGIMQYTAVPAAAGPSLLSIVLPGVALVSAIAAWTLRRRSPLLAWAAALLAATDLLIWSWRRRSHLDHAILPTDAPFWIDRVATAVTLVAAVVMIVIGVERAVRGEIVVVAEPRTADPGQGAAAVPNETT